MTHADVINCGHHYRSTRRERSARVLRAGFVGCIQIYKRRHKVKHENGTVSERCGSKIFPEGPL